MDKKPDTARSQKRKKKRGPMWYQKLKLSAMVWTASAFIWALRLTCRTEVVAGAANVEAALARGVVVPCGWHQQILISGLFLRGLVPRGLKAGFLASPSREGEFISRVAIHHRGKIMRGSSSRTGSEALKAIIKGTQEGISPMMYADGPRGPARVFKPGAVLLAQRTGTPILPVGCAVDRYWQIKSWDQTRIPKPFSRFTIAVGELWPVACENHQIDAVARQVGRKVDELTAVAEAAQS